MHQEKWTDWDVLHFIPSALVPSVYEFKLSVDFENISVTASKYILVCEGAGRNFQSVHES
jgi:hypothetical protein